MPSAKGCGRVRIFAFFFAVTFKLVKGFVKSGICFFTVFKVVYKFRVSTETSGSNITGNVLVGHF